MTRESKHSRLTDSTTPAATIAPSTSCLTGVVTASGDFGWLALLSPSLGYRLVPYIAADGLLGAVSIILRLLVFGVNERRWKEQANAAAASIWR